MKGIWLILMLMGRGNSYYLLDIFSEGVNWGNAKRANVDVYLSIYDLRNLNFKEGSFEADIAIGWEWKKDELRCPPELKFMNGEVKELEPYEEFCEEIVPGKWYIEKRYTATFFSSFTFKWFPFGSQTLEIVVEDFNHPLEIKRKDEFTFSPSQCPFIRNSSCEEEDERGVILVANNEHILIEEGLHLGGWKVKKFHSISGEHTYKYPKEEYIFSRYICKIYIVPQHQLSHILKTFLPFFVSLLIGFTVFIFPKDKTQERVGVGIASVFGVISSYIIFTQSLPERIGFTFGDIVHIAGLFFLLVIFLVVAFNTLHSK